MVEKEEKNSDKLKEDSIRVIAELLRSFDTFNRALIIVALFDENRVEEK